MDKTTLSELQQFLKKASSQTYAANNPPVKNPERPGFIELTFEEGNLSYRDSYTGHYRSAGSEVISYKGIPVWVSSYAGGMVAGQEKIAHQTFEFLKRAFLERDERSFRGPSEFKDGDWLYIYQQSGSMADFYGYEEIYFQKELVFTHRIIGGLIVNSQN